MHKYPRTPHLAGSRRQPGDEELGHAPFAGIRGRPVVVTEKLDGANAGISFTSGGQLLLQSRGHYLTGGPRERQFGPLKSWATTVAPALWPVLGDRYVLYGEWLYAKHTLFYDRLPHYFCAFDVLDSSTGEFLATARRTELLAGTPVVEVPVLRSGRFDSIAGLTLLAGPSRFRTHHWRQALADAARAAGVDPDRAVAETRTGPATRSSPTGSLPPMVSIRHDSRRRLPGRERAERVRPTSQPHSRPAHA